MWGGRGREPLQRGEEGVGVVGELEVARRKRWSAEATLEGGNGGGGGLGASLGDAWGDAVGVVRV